MSEDDAKKYLEQMKIDKPELLNEVKKYFLLFDDVVAMPDNIAAFVKKSTLNTFDNGENYYCQYWDKNCAWECPYD